MIDAPQRISIPFHDQRTHGLKISRIRDGLIHIWHHIVDMFFYRASRYIELWSCDMTRLLWSHQDLE